MSNKLGFRLAALIAILTAASLACQLGDTKTSNGERVQVNEHGFSLVPPAGTEVNNLGILGVEVVAAKPDKAGDNILGPICNAATSEHHFSIQENPQGYWTDATTSAKNITGLDLGAYQKTSVAGHFAIEADESGAYIKSEDPAATPIAGKRLDVWIDGKKVLVLTCEGPASRTSETLSLYASLKDSLLLFSPVTSTPKP